VLFGFPMDLDTGDEELLKSKRFLAHATYLLTMIESSLDMLGPDIELLTEIMDELGGRHSRYGVKPYMYPAMGEALMFTLDKFLGDKFKESSRDSWTEVYNALSADMICKIDH
jgi:hemoglobin-like flavoprotein